MARNLEFSIGEFYHLYNRGTEKRIIFTEPSDYARFVTLLYFCNGTRIVDLKLQGRTLYEIEDLTRGKSLVEISAYCLMPNHFHLIVREKQNGGTSQFMQKLLTGYTMYYNKKYERSGALFQGKFKARRLDTDPYLSYLVSYIHLNPVKLIEPFWKENGITDKIKAEKYLEDYLYSSYPDYIGENRRENLILDMNSLPGYFESAKDFKTVLAECLSYQELQGRTL